MPDLKKFNCPKCANTAAEAGEIRAAGGALSAMFDISTERFSYVTCTRCKFTEFYKVELSDLQKTLDFFIG